MYKDVLGFLQSSVYRVILFVPLRNPQTGRAIFGIEKLSFHFSNILMLWTARFCYIIKILKANLYYFLYF